MDASTNFNFYTHDMSMFVDETTTKTEDIDRCLQLRFKGCLDLATGCGHPPRAENIAWLFEAVSLIFHSMFITESSADTSVSYGSSNRIVVPDLDLDENEAIRIIEERTGVKISEYGKNAVVTTLFFLGSRYTGTAWSSFSRNRPIPLYRWPIVLCLMELHQTDVKNPLLPSELHDGKELGSMLFGSSSPEYSFLNSTIFLGRKKEIETYTYIYDEQHSLIRTESTYKCYYNGGHTAEGPFGPSSDSESSDPEIEGDCNLDWSPDDFRYLFDREIHESGITANRSLVATFSSTESLGSLLEESSDGCDRVRPKAEIIGLIADDVEKVKGVHLDKNNSFPGLKPVNAKQTVVNKYKDTHPDYNPPEDVKYYTEDIRDGNPFVRNTNIINSHSRSLGEFDIKTGTFGNATISTSENSTRSTSFSGDFYIFISDCSKSGNWQEQPPIISFSDMNVLLWVRSAVSKSREVYEYESFQVADEHYNNVATKREYTRVYSWYGEVIPVTFSFVGYSSGISVDTISAIPTSHSFYRVYKLNDADSVFMSIDDFVSGLDYSFLPDVTGNNIFCQRESATYEYYNVDFNSPVTDIKFSVEIPRC